VDAALGAGVGLVRMVDGYINATAPFKLAKTVGDDPGARVRLGSILYRCAEAVRVASVIMSPALTQRVPVLWRTWGCEPATGATLADLCAFGGRLGLKPGGRISKGEILYMRADSAAGAP
jgi:methionyl-tRNA synthetase